LAASRPLEFILFLRVLLTCRVVCDSVKYRVVKRVIAQNSVFGEGLERTCADKHGNQMNDAMGIEVPR